MFQKIKIFSLSIVFIFGTTALAQTKANEDRFWKVKNDWALHIYGDLFAHCNQVPREKWIQKYKAYRMEVFLNLDALGKRVGDIPIRSPYADLAELIFPDVRPDAYPDGNFDVCVPSFDKFYQAKNSADAQQYLGPLKNCYDDHYRGEQSETLKSYFSCLQQLKD